MKKGMENDSAQAREDALEELFRHAEPRERAPSGREREIRDSLREQWTAMNRRRTRKRRAIFAAAASLAAVAVAMVVMDSAPVQPVAGDPVAAVVLTRGHTSFNNADGTSGSRLGARMMLVAGQEIRTAAGGGVTLRWHNGITLRFDQESRAKLLSTNRAELLFGRVYVDTDTAKGPEADLAFVTPAGPVRHEGTRYMVGVQSGDTRVSVREGQVLLGTEKANGGERLTVTADGEQTREAIESYGEQWAWTEQLAVPFETDGKTVADVLSWVARETGRVVEYESDQARRLAEETRIRGNIGEEPLKVLELTMQTTDLAAEVREGSIRVGKGPGR